MFEKEVFAVKHLKVGLLLISTSQSPRGLVLAGTITYTDYATVSRTLGGIPFSNALFTVVMVNNTNNVLCGQAVLHNLRNCHVFS